MRFLCADITQSSKVFCSVRCKTAHHRWTLIYVFGQHGRMHFHQWSPCSAGTILSQEGKGGRDLCVCSKMCRISHTQILTPINPDVYGNFGSQIFLVGLETDGRKSHCQIQSSGPFPPLTTWTACSSSCKIAFFAVTRPLWSTSIQFVFVHGTNENLDYSGPPSASSTLRCTAE